MLRQHACMAGMTEEWRLQGLPERSNLDQLFEYTKSLSGRARRIQTGQTSALHLLADKPGVQAGLQRRRRALCSALRERQQRTEFPFDVRVGHYSTSCENFVAREPTAAPLP